MGFLGSQKSVKRQEFLVCEGSTGKKMGVGDNLKVEEFIKAFSEI